MSESLELRHAQDDIWRRIEREAAAHCSADIQRAEQTPLHFGDFIAWADQKFARTDELSEVHRVGYPQKNEPYTTCGAKIPAPALWLTLSPRFMQSLGPCRFCEAEYQRAIQEHAA